MNEELQKIKYSTNEKQNGDEIQIQTLEPKLADHSKDKNANSLEENTDSQEKMSNVKVNQHQMNDLTKKFSQMSISQEETSQSQSQNDKIPLPDSSNYNNTNRTIEETIKSYPDQTNSMNEDLELNLSSIQHTTQGVNDSAITYPLINNLSETQLQNDTMCRYDEPNASKAGDPYNQGQYNSINAKRQNNENSVLSTKSCNEFYPEKSIQQKEQSINTEGGQKQDNQVDQSSIITLNNVFITQQFEEYELSKENYPQNQQNQSSISNNLSTKSEIVDDSLKNLNSEEKISSQETILQLNNLSSTQQSQEFQYEDYWTDEKDQYNLTAFNQWKEERLPSRIGGLFEIIDQENVIEGTSAPEVTITSQYSNMLQKSQFRGEKNVYDLKDNLKLLGRGEIENLRIQGFPLSTSKIYVIKIENFASKKNILKIPMKMSPELSSNAHESKIFEKEFRQNNYFQT